MSPIRAYRAINPRCLGPARAEGEVRCHGSGVAQIARPEGSGDSKDFTGRNERQFRITRKTGTARVARNLLLELMRREFIHETPIRFVVLAVRVHRIRSRRWCGGRRAASRL